MKYVTVEQVVEAHDALLAKYGGMEGGGHRGEDYQGVDAAVRAVENAYYDNPYHLAAAYAVYIVQGHVFLDGNKRAASFAMLEFLKANCIPIRIAKRRLISCMVEMQQRSEGGESAGDLILWVAAQISSGHR